MVTIVLLSTLFILAIVSFYFVNKKLHPSSKYLFQSWEKVDMPYITLDICGHKLNMITDSAASVSVIRKDVLDKLQWEPSSRKISLAALTNDSMNTEVIVVPVVIKGKETKHDFVVYDNKDIAGFKSKYGVSIHGILGVEFFKKTGGIVNFNKHTVTFP